MKLIGPDEWLNLTKPNYLWARIDIIARDLRWKIWKNITSKLISSSKYC